MKRIGFVFLGWLLAFSLSAQCVSEIEKEGGGNIPLSTPTEYITFTHAMDPPGVFSDRACWVEEKVGNKWSVVQEDCFSHGNTTAKINRQATEIALKASGRFPKFTQIKVHQAVYLEPITESLDFGTLEYGESATKPIYINYSAKEAEVQLWGSRCSFNKTWVGTPDCKAGVDTLWVTYSPKKTESEWDVITLGDKLIYVYGNGYLPAPTELTPTAVSYTYACFKWKADPKTEHCRVEEPITKQEKVSYIRFARFDGLEPNKEYRFYVYAVCEDGESSYASIDISTLKPEIIAQPSTEVDHESFLAQWSALNRLDDYQLIVKEKKTGKEVFNQMVKRPSYRVQGLQASTEYTYTVVGKTEGLTITSNEVTVTTTEPTYFPVEVIGEGPSALSSFYQLKLVKGEQNFKGNFSVGSVVKVTASSTVEEPYWYFDKLVIQGKEYTQPSVDFTTTGNDVIKVYYYFLEAPSQLKVEKTASTSVDISWKEIPKAHRYELFVYNAAGKLVFSENFQTSVPQYSIRGLQPATLYQCRLKAYGEKEQFASDFSAYLPIPTAEDTMNVKP